MRLLPSSPQQAFHAEEGEHIVSDVHFFGTREHLQPRRRVHRLSEAVQAVITMQQQRFVLKTFAYILLKY
jgi:hypothetical protein